MPSIDAKDMKRTPSSKPCPFCSGTDCPVDNQEMTPFERLHINGNEGYFYYVVCQTCYAQGPFELTREDAVNAWNRRYSKEKEL